MAPNQVLRRVNSITNFILMKRTALTFFNLIFLKLLFSQNLGPSNVIIGSNQPQSGVIDGVYEKKDVLAKKRAIPYEFVRENDYVWGKRTWSYIDLREKINHPLYFPHEKIDVASSKILEMPQGRYSLYFILQMALRKGQLMAYKDQTEATIKNPIVRKGGDDFSIPIPRDYSLPVSQDSKYNSAIETECVGIGKFDEANDSKAKMIGQDTVFWLAGSKIEDPKLYDATDQNGPYNLDPNTETLDKTKALIDQTTNLPAPVIWCPVKQEYYQSRDIVKYLLKEDWFFDKERSVLDVRTIGIAPVVIEDSTEMNEKILFWLYFPQVRDVLKNYYVYDAKSTVGGNTFDHLFMTRRFNAVVYKESTLYDRKIEDYRFGADALYESEKVKNTIRTFEHDVWNF